MKPEYNPYISPEFLQRCEDSDLKYQWIKDKAYGYGHYEKKMNLFTFGKWHWDLSFGIIGPPASVDAVGYQGDLRALIKGLNKQKGNFLLLNLTQKDVDPILNETGFIWGRTLSSWMFHRSFDSYESYKKALRSAYRRRAAKAKTKAKDLAWEKIHPHQFDKSLYDLYLQVLCHSDFPLETLGVQFFAQSPGTIWVLKCKEKPLAFVLLEETNTTLQFVFGGMDYSLCDEKDLYTNMLLKIIEEGTAGHYAQIHFGQTADSSKARIGCAEEKRYLIFITSNPFLRFIVRVLKPFLEYRSPKEKYRVFRSH